MPFYVFYGKCFEIFYDCAAVAVLGISQFQKQIYDIQL